LIFYLHDNVEGEASQDWHDSGHWQQRQYD